MAVQAQEVSKDTSHDAEVYNTAIVPFTHLLKSEDKARHHLAILKALADKGPYQYSTFVRLSQRLLVAGVEELEELKFLYAASLAANALTDDETGFARIALTMGDLKLKNITPASGAIILLDMGLPVYKLTAEELKIKEDRARRLIENGTLTGEDLTVVLVAAFSHRYNFTSK